MPLSVAILNTTITHIATVLYSIPFLLEGRINNLTLRNQGRIFSLSV